MDYVPSGDKRRRRVTNTSDEKQQLAANLGKRMRLKATNGLSHLVGIRRPIAGDWFTQRTRWGMVSSKIQGFQLTKLTESRRHSRLIERVKLFGIGAVNVRF